jgi:hypothetical protein
MARTGRPKDGQFTPYKKKTWYNKKFYKKVSLFS